MSGTKVEVTYLGKPARLNPKTREVVEYHKKYTIKDYPGDNWREGYAKEFRKILSEFEGIKEIRFFVKEKEKIC